MHVACHHKCKALCAGGHTHTYINVLSQSRLFYLKISTIDCQAAQFSLFCLRAVGSRKRPRTRSVDCRPLVGGAKMELPRPSNNVHAIKCCKHLSLQGGGGGIDGLEPFELFEH